MPGTYTRSTGEVDWRRSFTDSAGEIWTPFASFRADAINADRFRTSRAFRTTCPIGDTQALRVMPTVGLEYRYPFINVQPWGTTTIEPIAQVIIRPNESYAGKLPNEDAQSMTFDTSNLFSVDKFSGYDRVEGGGRANAGVQATTQFDHGGIGHRGVRAVLPAVRPEFVCGADMTNTGRRFRSADAGVGLRRAASATRPTGPIPSARARDSTRRPGAPALRGRRPSQLRPLVGEHPVRRLRRRSRTSDI